MFPTPFIRSDDVPLPMTEVACNTSKSICSASQYRIRLEEKLKALLGEERIAGTLDPYINRAADSGKISAEDAETLLKISKYIDHSYTTCDGCRLMTFDRLKSWSEVVERI